jgi:putative SOS response-associated peptidase YedK
MDEEWQHLRASGSGLQNAQRLHEGDFNRWLDREETDQPPIDLLRPFPAGEMEALEVSRDVGNVRNNSADLLNSK